MVSIIYCTRESNPEHSKHLKKVLGHDKVEVIEYINNGESLTKFYNKGLQESKFDIVIFCHDDIILDTKQIANKITKLFDKNPEYGIIGVAGSKYLSSSGVWWEDRGKMYGRVSHTHEGKTWLSAYSDDLGQDLEEVVVVDGLFFVVNKKRIKEQFNDEVNGFHFYDVDFCFRNHISGVKVGVTTTIKITHKSIGMTNQQWEDNRKQFSETYVEQLPIKLKRVVKPNQKLKILIGCLSFANLTGSELYVFEMAKELVKKGCEVSICSNIGLPLSKMATNLGIKLYSLQEPPGFKIGDGKWLIQGPQGFKPTEPNKIYKVQDVKFDVLHLNHKPVTEHLLRFYPETDTICTIHSEVLELEVPVIHPKIKKYIAIRPEIKDLLVDKHNIPSEMIDVIYNPIDYTRFKIVNDNNKRNNKRVIFTGTIDYLRKNALLDLIKSTREEGNELWIVGKENGVTMQDLIIEDGGTFNHVTYHQPTPNVEKLVQQCDETAGILLGRTTIEGWLCGKGGWIYDVDDRGNILDKTFHYVPNDIDKFRADNVVNEIINKYKEVIEL
jgi:glycosyltransferase involved in cell wall biosynthesis